jgi:hypothetical protein
MLVNKKNPTGLTQNQTMKQTYKFNVILGRRMVCILLSIIVLLWFSRPAHAVNYEGAFYVDSPTAVTTLQNKGFNVFMIPGGLSHSNIQSTLAAITAPGAGAIVVLNGFDDAGATAFMDWVQSIPEYSKVLAIETFSEPNAVFVPLSRQRAWYSALKSRDPSKPVFEVFYANGCGLMHKELIDPTPGLSWDFVMVYTYPYWWNVTDALLFIFDAINFQDAPGAAFANCIRGVLIDVVGGKF